MCALSGKFSSVLTNIATVFYLIDSTIFFGIFYRFRNNFYTDHFFDIF